MSFEDPLVARGKRPWGLLFIILTILGLGAVVIVFRPKPKPPLETRMVVTVADLQPIHSRVTAAGNEVRALTRLAVGDPIATDEGGRARLRLDNGTAVVLDGSTTIELTKDGFKVLTGRVFVEAKTLPTLVELELGSITAVGSTLFVERRKKTTAYVGSGEVTARKAGKEAAVTTGDSVDFDEKLEVRPERGFEDWTAGLAAPWSANGALRRTVGEIWGRTAPGEVGSPLTIRSQEVQASVFGEMATTVVRTTFFNAGSVEVLGDYRTGIPEGALVSGFRTKRGDAWKTGRLVLAHRAQALDFEKSRTASADLLEWAGEGWLRGTISRIAPGQLVTVEVSYVEWLRVRPGDQSHQVQYRYPLVGEEASPLIGDFTIVVDAGPAEATRVAAGMGAAVDESKVVLKRSDFRASADFVVDIEIPRPLAKARAYVVDGAPDDQETTVFLRTEAPRLEGTAEEGVSLALVVDTSASVDPSLLAAGRAFVEALLGSLGPKDRVIVLAADSETRAIGPAEIGFADAARKKAISDGLAALTPAGATDLGRALEAAANRLPKDAPSGMVVYVGDGFPSVGDRTPEAIAARLSRRKAGSPRLGAVLVGPSGNRRLFADLTRGSGFLTEIADSEEGARASVDLLGKAIVPTVTGVEAKLGPAVARSYPRNEAAVAQGSTISLVGKLVGETPTSFELSYRQGEKTVSEKRSIELFQIDDRGDLDRRWSEARASSMALSGKGREAVTESALKAKLLTPWTLFSTDGLAESMATPLETRVLDLGVSGSPFAVSLSDKNMEFRSFSSEEDAASVWAEPSLETAVNLATVRTLQEARGQMKACRDSRVALRPDLPPSVAIELKMDGDGRPSDIVIQNAGDDALARCLTTVVANLSYPKVFAKLSVTVQHTIVWPLTESLRGKKCSPTSTLSVPLRRGVWRERLDRTEAYAAYLEAKRGCELESWTAKRALLELTLSWFSRRGSASLEALDLAQQLSDIAEDEAANFLRKEAIKRSSPAELRQLRKRLLFQERLPMAAFLERYNKAKDDAERLSIINTFSVLAPHDRRLRELFLSLLLSTGRKAELVEEINKLRVDPFADAGLIAHAAHLLRLSGDEVAAKRTYGEIAERSTEDPWALAFVGDKLRAEGWYDDATFAYEGLLALAPGDGSAEIRLALAHAGAGRIDVALRGLAAVGRTGGRDGQAEVALLAERFAAVLVRRTIAAEKTSSEERAGLERTLAEMVPLPAGVPLLIEPPAGRNAPRTWMERGAEKAREFVAPEALLGRVGLIALRVEPNKEGDVFVVLTKDKELPPVEPYVVRVTALVGGKAVSTDVTLPNSGERVEVPWNGTTFGAPKLIKGQEAL